MKFVIDDSKIFFNGSNNEAKVMINLSQWLGDKSVKPEDVNDILFKGKIIDSHDFISDETVLIKFMGDALVEFLKSRSDIYESDDLVWDKNYEVYRIGNYIFFKVKKDESAVVGKIKSLIKSYRLSIKKESTPE